MENMQFKIRGMNRDNSLSTFDNKEAYEIYNMRVKATDSQTTFALTNERGTKNIVLYPKNIYNSLFVEQLLGAIIGATVLDNTLYVFTHEEIDNLKKDRLYEIKKDNFNNRYTAENLFKRTENIDAIQIVGSNSYKEIDYVDLNLDLEHPLDIIPYFESVDIKKLYWIDGKNQARMFNVVSRNMTFDFLPEVSSDNIITIEKKQGGGKFPAGVIQYCFTMGVKYGQESNIFYTSPLYYLTRDDNSGLPVGEYTSCHFEIVFNKIDLKSFDHVVIYSLLRSSLNGAVECSRVGIITKKELLVKPQTVVRRTRKHLVIKQARPVSVLYNEYWWDDETNKNSDYEYIGDIEYPEKSDGLFYETKNPYKYKLPDNYKEAWFSSSSLPATIDFNDSLEYNTNINGYTSDRYSYINLNYGDVILFEITTDKTQIENDFQLDGAQNKIPLNVKIYEDKLTEDSCVIADLYYGDTYNKESVAQNYLSYYDNTEPVDNKIYVSLVARKLATYIIVITGEELAKQLLLNGASRLLYTVISLNISNQDFVDEDCIRLTQSLYTPEMPEICYGSSQTSWSMPFIENSLYRYDLIAPACINYDNGSLLSKVLSVLAENDLKYLVYTNPITLNTYSVASHFNLQKMQQYLGNDLNIINKKRIGSTGEVLNDYIEASTSYKVYNDLISNPNLPIILAEIFPTVFNLPKSSISNKQRFYVNISLYLPDEGDTYKYIHWLTNDISSYPMSLGQYTLTIPSYWTYFFEKEDDSLLIDLQNKRMRNNGSVQDRGVEATFYVKLTRYQADGTFVDDEDLEDDWQNGGSNSVYLQRFNRETLCYKGENTIILTSLKPVNHILEVNYKAENPFTKIEKYYGETSKDVERILTWEGGTISIPQFNQYASSCAYFAAGNYQNSSITFNLESGINYEDPTIKAAIESAVSNDTDAWEVLRNKEHWVISEVGFIFNPVEKPVTLVVGEAFITENRAVKVTGDTATKWHNWLASLAESGTLDSLLNPIKLDYNNIQCSALDRFYNFFDSDIAKKEGGITTCLTFNLYPGEKHNYIDISGENQQHYVLGNDENIYTPINDRWLKESLEIGAYINGIRHIVPIEDIIFEKKLGVLSSNAVTQYYYVLVPIYTSKEDSFNGKQVTKVYFKETVILPSKEGLFELIPFIKLKNNGEEFLIKLDQNVSDYNNISYTYIIRGIQLKEKYAEKYEPKLKFNFTEKWFLANFLRLLDTEYNLVYLDLQIISTKNVSGEDLQMLSYWANNPKFLKAADINLHHHIQSCPLNVKSYRYELRLLEDAFLLLYKDWKAQIIAIYKYRWCLAYNENYKNYDVTEDGDWQYVGFNSVNYLKTTKDGYAIKNSLSPFTENIVEDDLFYYSLCQRSTFKLLEEFFKEDEHNLYTLKTKYIPTGGVIDADLLWRYIVEIDGNGNTKQFRLFSPIVYYSIPLYSLQYNIEESDPPVFIDDHNSSQEIVDIGHLLITCQRNLIIPQTFAVKNGTLFLGNLSISTPVINDDIIEKILNKGEANKNWELYNSDDTNSILLNANIHQQTRVLSWGNAEPYSKTELSNFNLNSLDLKIFKGREFYRLGILFSNNYLEKSEVVDLGFVKIDPMCNSEKGVETSYPTYYLTEDTILNLAAKGYTKARLMMEEEAAENKSVIGLGIISPTVFNYSLRNGNTPFSMSSWFFRPLGRGALFENKHYAPIKNNTSVGAEIETVELCASNISDYPSVEKSVVGESIWVWGTFNFRNFGKWARRDDWMMVRMLLILLSGNSSTNYTVSKIFPSLKNDIEVAIEKYANVEDASTGKEKGSLKGILVMGDDGDELPVIMIPKINGFKLAWPTISVKVEGKDDTAILYYKEWDPSGKDKKEWAYRRTKGGSMNGGGRDRANKFVGFINDFYKAAGVSAPQGRTLPYTTTNEVITAFDNGLTNKDEIRGGFGTRLKIASSAGGIVLGGLELSGLGATTLLAGLVGGTSSLTAAALLVGLVFPIISAVLGALSVAGLIVSWVRNKRAGKPWSSSKFLYGTAWACVASTSPFYLIEPRKSKVSAFFVDNHITTMHFPNIDNVYGAIENNPTVKCRFVGDFVWDKSYSALNVLLESNRHNFNCSGLLLDWNPSKNKDAVGMYPGYYDDFYNDLFSTEYYYPTNYFIYPWHNSTSLGAQRVSVTGSTSIQSFDDTKELNEQKKGRYILLSYSNGSQYGKPKYKILSNTRVFKLGNYWSDGKKREAGVDLTICRDNERLSVLNYSDSFLYDYTLLNYQGNVDYVYNYSVPNFFSAGILNKSNEHLLKSFNGFSISTPLNGGIFPSNTKQENYTEECLSLLKEFEYGHLIRAANDYILGGILYGESEGAEVNPDNWQNSKVFNWKWYGYALNNKETGKFISVDAGRIYKGSKTITIWENNGGSNFVAPMPNSNYEDLLKNPTTENIKSIIVKGDPIHMRYRSTPHVVAAFTDAKVLYTSMNKIDASGKENNLEKFSADFIHSEAKKGSFNSIFNHIVEGRLFPSLSNDEKKELIWTPIVELYTEPLNNNKPASKVNWIPIGDFILLHEKFLSKYSLDDVKEFRISIADVKALLKWIADPDVTEELLDAAWWKYWESIKKTEVFSGTTIQDYFDVSNKSTYMGLPITSTTEYWVDDAGNTQRKEVSIFGGEELKITSLNFDNFLKILNKAWPEGIEEILRNVDLFSVEFLTFLQNIIKEEIVINPQIVYDGTNDRTGIYGTEGDHFYGRWECLKTYAYDEKDVNLIVDIVSVPLESSVNLNARTDRNRGQQDNTLMSPKNFNIFNDVYNQSNNLFTYHNSNIESDNEIFSNEVIWSLTKNITEETDNWTCVTTASVLDLDGSNGELVKLKLWKDNLLAFLTRAVSYIPFDTRALVQTSDDVPIELTNASKVPDSPVVLFGSIGCLNKWSIQNSVNYLYFIDSYNQAIYRLGGEAGYENITDLHGFHSWMHENNNYHSWNLGSNRSAFKTDYDPINNELLFTNGNTTLCFSETNNTFTSFYDYEDSTFFTKIDNSLFTFTNHKNDEGYYTTKMWQLWGGDYNTIFDKPVKYSLSIIANENPLIAKVFNTLTYTADGFYYSSITGKYDTYDYRISFDTIKAEDEYLFGVYNITTIPTDLVLPYPLKKKFRVWNIDIPRDGDSVDNVGIVDNSRADRMSNPWLKITLSRNNTDERFSNHRLNIYDLAVNYTVL